MFWAKLLVIFCIILDLISGDYVYYRRGRKNRHHHVYDCGYDKCVRRKSPPVCKQWCLVYFFDGFCRRARYECCSYREKPGCCPADSGLCPCPFPYYYTSIYECRHDFNCPSGYKCCQDSCYVHKVCKPSTNKPSNSGTTSSSSSRDTEETTVRTTGTTKKVTSTAVGNPKPTTAVQTTTTGKTTTEKATTTASSTEVTTTTSPQTTTTEAQTTITTSEIKHPTTIPDTTTSSTTQAQTTASPKTTTAGEIAGSGDDEVPEPEPAKFLWRRHLSSGFDDDEDIIQAIMRYS